MMQRILFSGLLFISQSALGQLQLTSRIQLNQLGFYPHAPKVAVVTGSVPASEFFVTTTNAADTVYRGRLQAERSSRNSSTVTRLADFSALDRPGIFFLVVPGLGHSYTFRIGPAVHRDLATAVLKGFYFQRVSMPLESRFAGRWHRSAGHPDTAVYIHASAASASRPAGTIISSPGGWYDAGDYNKYIVNSGITMGQLLSAYEDFAPYFDTISTGIPESRDRIPDLLNECLYNLRWMLTMQDPADGGVYHKCTNAAFDGMVMPGITRLPRYVVQKSTAAALDFAAVMAQAARIFRRFPTALPRLADSCRRASEQAWQWALQNPAVLYEQNAMNRQHQPAISTGAYGDRNLKDEWLWAASELFATTQGATYLDTVRARFGDSLGLQSWSQVGLMGYYTLHRLGHSFPPPLATMVQEVREKIIAFADSLAARVAGNAFATIMGGLRSDFVWGSSAVAANQGIALVQAWRITGDMYFLDHALSNLDYLMGRNATGYCFVTGSGSRPPMHPHHRPSVADGVTEPVPGLLSGGPNPGRQDSCQYLFTEPETAFTDHDCSYASNEIAINWNAPLVYLAHCFEALQYQVGYSSK